MSELTNLAEQVLAKATHIIVDHDQELEPVWFLAADENKMNIVHTPWDSELQQEAFLQALKMILREQEQVRFYIHVSEGWSSSQDSTPAAERELEPRLRSNRREIVIITGCTRDYTEELLWTAPITTLENGRRLVGAVDKSDGLAGGRMSNLFPRRVM